MYGYEHHCDRCWSDSMGIGSNVVVDLSLNPELIVHYISPEIMIAQVIQIRDLEGSYGAISDAQVSIYKNEISR